MTVLIDQSGKMVLQYQSVTLAHIDAWS